MDEPLLSVSRVSKRYAGIDALSDVGFDLREREIVGIIGPNGAGRQPSWAGIKKGAGVYVEGRLTMNTWEGKDGLGRERGGVPGVISSIRRP